MPKIKVNEVNLYYELHGSGEPLVLVSTSSSVEKKLSGAVKLIKRIPKHRLKTVTDSLTL